MEPGRGLGMPAASPVALYLTLSSKLLSNSRPELGNLHSFSIVSLY